MNPHWVADAIFWIAAVSCLLAQTLILRSALRRRGASELENGGSIPAPRRGTEIVWTVLPALVLVVLFLATWQAMHRNPPTTPQRSAAHTEWRAS